MPGRPRKPYLMHVAQGTERAYVKAQNAESLKLKPGSVGDCPAWLPPEGCEEWKRLTGDEDYRRCLSPSTRGALIDYCNLFGRMIRAERRMPEWVDGKATEDLSMPDGSIVPAPRERFIASERQNLHSLRMQLGLTPASASKAKDVTAAVPATNDPWSKLG